LETIVTLYAIFDPQPGKPDLPRVLPEAFSWFAAILPPFFCLAHGLWLALALWIVKLVALVLLSGFLGGDVATLLYLLLAVWLGFAAPGLRRRALLRRGWRHRGDRVAPSADLARLEALS
jgi:hypothetical protein